MINVFIDFETYYDKDCTLKKQSTIEYVMDPRSKTLGVSVAIDLDTARFMSEEEFLLWSKVVPWHDAMVIAHNCKFDAMILTQRYKIKPARYCCTQSMANATLEVRSKSLASVANFLNLGEKGNALVEGSSEVTEALRTYANNDLALCRRIYYRLVPYLPSQELDLISLTVRMAVEPWLILNGPLLEQVRNEEIRRRSDAIKASGFAESQLTSNPQFAAILRTHRITVPTKTSNATGLETEAFSKGDEEFVSLMLEYPQYKHLWEGRLAAKSNINIRRPEKLLNIVDCNGGLLPVTYTYYGAHTGRYSGTDGINLQNLPHKSKSRLRECIRAPKGYQIGVVDSSQIELRLNMWFTDQMDKVELLRKGGDIYRTEAAKQFGISEAEVTKDQRQFGKVVQLGCFPAGAPVLTPRGLVPIEKITLDDLVWDGVEWVSHEGVIDQGIQEVMTYDNVTATLDHKVWAEGYRNPISIEYAASKMVRLTRTGSGRKPIRYVESSQLRICSNKRIQIHSMSVRMWNRAISFLGQFKEGQIPRMYVQFKEELQSLRAYMADSSSKSVNSSKDAMPKSTQCGVSTLRRTWNNVRFQFSSRSSRVDYPKFGTSIRRSGVGSNRQQSRLRSWQFTLGDSIRTVFKQTLDSLDKLAGNSNPRSILAFAFSSEPNITLCEFSTFGGSNYRARETSGSEEIPKLERYPSSTYRTRVYDILNAGPRHRFTVYDTLVSNCGYGMGASKFRRYCAAGPLGLDPIILTADQAFDAINVYRKAHPKVTETWTDLDKILWKIWKPKCEKYTYKFIHFHHEVVQLPNGMLLQYPKLGPSEDGDAIVYQGAKEKLPIWGGLLCQNIVQALARIVNMYQMLEIDKQFRVVGTTHDEVWFLVPNGAEKEAEEYALRCMSTPPDWAPDLPVSAEFIIAEHYCK